VRTDSGGIKVLAVDLVGTLTKKVDMTFAVRASEYLSQNGHDIEPARVRRLHRKRYLEYSMGNYANDREFYSVLSVDLGIQAWEPWFEALTDLWIQYSTPFDDAQRFLEQAGRTHRLILSSNYVAEWARRMLVNYHWEDYFQALVVSSDCGLRKPSRQFFLELLRVSGVTSPDEVLVIGDSLANDVYGATRAGLQAVLVERSPEAREPELPKGALSVQSLDELMQCLTGGHLIPR